MNFWKEVLSFIFPPVCGMCGKQAKSYLCEECIKKLEKENKLLNRIESYENNSNSYFAEHCYLFAYEGIMREKILQYKFKNKAYLANMFFEFFVKNEKVCGFLKKYDIMVAVPMSHKKISQRGYNQSELIARKISNYLNIPFQKSILIKAKENETQSTLNRKQRWENVKNVYKVQNEQKIKEKNILIFDDIFTTGATRYRVCQSLKRGRSKEIQHFNNC